MADPSPTPRPATGWPMLAGSLRWVPLGTALALALIGWGIHSTVERAARQKMAAEIETVLQTDVTALRVWIAAQERAARVIADDETVQRATAELLRLSARQGVSAAVLQPAPEQELLRAELEPLCKAHSFEGYAVIDPAGNVLASFVPRLVATPMPRDELPALRRVLAGETVLCPPFRSPVPLEEGDEEPVEGVPVMFVGAPIVDAASAPIAALALRMDPAEDFARLLGAARIGESGETYAFDERGVMISPSRFDEQLKRLGLIPDTPPSRSTLQVELRDPGVDLTRGRPPAARRSEQPLTRMAEAALRGESGVDVDGYRDYRGVEVIGAWEWLGEHGFGVATEVDAAEAYRPLWLLRTAFSVLFALLVLASVAMLFSSRVAFLMKRRAERAMDQVQRMGQYTLEERIGEGGMGEVYRARHAFLRRPTAVKLLHASRTSDQDLARFEREVQSASQLTHPNTIAIYDYGRTDDGVFYYAMEYLPGVTLARLVERAGPMPAARAIHLLLQVCGSLEEAHTKGLIHRDVKPANLIVCERGGQLDVVKVVDFGLVKPSGRPGADGDPGTLTAPDMIAGTPQYLAPEAIRGDAVDRRSDLYSLGCVAYYLLAGVEPFDGDSALEIVAHQLDDEPAAPSRRAGRPIPPDLEQLVLACLAKDPAARPQSAAELAARLRRCADAFHWTQEDARAWWAEHGGRFEGAPRRAAPVSPSMLVRMDFRNN